MSATDWLSREVVTLAWTWRVGRRDGAVLGFTTHDRDLVRGGVRYRAAPGMAPSAVRLSASLDPGTMPETMDVGGAISDAAITAADLDAGRWDGALVTLGVLDWSDADAAAIVVAAGTLGAVRREGVHFTAELMGFEARLGDAVVPFTSPRCRANLGDKAYRIDLSGRRLRSEAIAIAGALVTLSEGFAVGRFARGRLRWIDGPRAGLSAAILADDGVRVELAEQVADHMLLPLRVALTEGCDGALATCSGRFANAANFRGEPFLPGNDLLTRYPGG